MEEQESEKYQQDLILKPSSSAESNSMVSATLGRVMYTLLNAQPKKLQHSISNLLSPPKIAAISVSLEQSLWFLHKYVGEAAEKEETLDDVLIPMIEHSLKFRESRHSNLVLILLNWLFQDEILFQALARNLAEIISRKADRYIALGWCTLARSLIEYDISMDKLTSNGIQEKYTALLTILCSCISHLLALTSSGSILQGAFELPTRLAVASADFIISLTVALTRKEVVSHLTYNEEKLHSLNFQHQQVSLLDADSSERKVKETRKSSVFAKEIDTKLLLWDHMDDLIILVGRLEAWSKKSRPLHARGLERVLKWLQATQTQYICFQNEADMQILKTGILLLSSCWKHYGLLLHLEDYNFPRKYKEMLDEYLSGIQFYADNHTDEPAADKDSAVETIKFFLNCLSLLIGRLDKKKLETAIEEHGPLLSKVLVSQLRSADEEVIDSAVYIFKATIFRTQLNSSKDFNAQTGEIDSVLPMLIHFLDERDGAAKAVVKLVAEYCFLCSDSHCLQNVLKELIDGKFSQRMNAVDVISDLVHLSLESGTSLSHQMWQDIADYLLQFLEDDELVIQTRASALLPVIDPSIIFPALVRLIYAPNERVQSLASETVLAVLKCHKEESRVLCLLLDCLSNLCNALGALDVEEDVKGSKVDSDRVLKLLPEWSKMVEDWSMMIGALLDKLFVEPSNAVIVRSLSYISEHLANLADLVFHQLILYMSGQNDIQESVSRRESGSCQNVDSLDSLFSRLCPLLVIRLLPLRVFDNLTSPLLYGEHFKENLMHGTGPLTIGTECIGALLFNRAFNKFEFEDVRKLAAELCGRIHPHILIPVVSSQLEFAANSEDIMKIKACLFSICTSLLVRGKDSYYHPGMRAIRKTINTILSWPSADRNDVLKAQHGCIDCLAWMMCTELEGSKPVRSLTSNEARAVQKDHYLEDIVLDSSVCDFVIGILTEDDNVSISSGLGKWRKESESTMCLSFRLCMANVLISACQKVSESGQKPLARKILPPIIGFYGVIVESEIRAGCNQVLFSVVYHLKSAVLPFSSDILKVALGSLRDETEKVRITGAKLLASLMASEEAVVGSISGGLLEARTLLHSISASDSSMEVRQLCQKLLACMTS